MKEVKQFYNYLYAKEEVDSFCVNHESMMSLLTKLLAAAELTMQSNSSIRYMMHQILGYNGKTPNCDKTLLIANYTVIRKFEEKFLKEIPELLLFIQQFRAEYTYQTLYELLKEKYLNEAS